MRIGLDLDNTIICYDELFRSVALETGLIEPGVPSAKAAVKEAVMAAHGNDIWTELQAEVYGPRLSGAVAYPGALEFAGRARDAGHELAIISHKTKFAARGPAVDLRDAASRWLEANGWTRVVPVSAIEFHATRDEKVQAIARRGCEVFVDDLVEVFEEPGFPRSTKRVLFDPEGTGSRHDADFHARTWAEIEPIIEALHHRL